MPPIYIEETYTGDEFVDLIIEYIDPKEFADGKDPIPDMQHELSERTNSDINTTLAITQGLQIVIGQTPIVGVIGSPGIEVSCSLTVTDSKWVGYLALNRHAGMKYVALKKILNELNAR